MPINYSRLTIDVYVIKARNLVNFPVGLYSEWGVNQEYLKTLKVGEVNVRKRFFLVLLLSQCR